MNVVYLFIAGGIGCVCRYGLSMGMKTLPFTLPVATLAANVIACIVFAIVLVACKSQAIQSESLRLLLLTGFCGGLSTFSSFSYETMELMRTGQYLYAMLNIAANILLCFLCFYFAGFSKT